MKPADIAAAVGAGIDLAGVVVIVGGVAVATATFARRVPRRDGFAAAYRKYRRGLGQAILLGLEFLVAGDIIRTVAVSPTFGSVGVLAVIVIIRTFLSLSLEVEVTGRLPWRQGEEDASRSGARSRAR